MRCVGSVVADTFDATVDLAAVFIVLLAVFISYISGSYELAPFRLVIQQLTVLVLLVSTKAVAETSWLKWSNTS